MKATKTDQGRRSFLRRAAATGVAAGAAAASVDAVAGVVPDEEKTEGKTGYRVSDHVKAYYKSLTR